MSATPRSDFPVFAAGRVGALGEATVMLNGMEVLFDRKVELAPVTLVRKRDSDEPAR
jgi:hypothetical protein